MDILEKIDMMVGDINEESEYQKFFQKELKDWGYSSINDMDEDEKKKFFDHIEKEWKGDTKDTDNDK